VPTVPVAVKVSGEPVRDPLVAVSVFVPAVVPRIQLPTVATPLESVVAVAPVIVPPPDATANVTLTPLTGASVESVTITLGSMVTAVPAVTDWPSPACFTTCVASPATGATSNTKLRARAVTRKIQFCFFMLYTRNYVFFCRLTSVEISICIPTQ